MTAHQLDDWSVLILHSEDGQDYVRVVLYPTAWGSQKADDLAVEAFEVAQAANPDEWSWDDYEPELVARGFVVPLWHHGPTWDSGR